MIKLLQGLLWTCKTIFCGSLPFCPECWKRTFSLIMSGMNLPIKMNVNPEKACVVMAMHVWDHYDCNDKKPLRHESRDWAAWLSTCTWWYLHCLHVWGSAITVILQRVRHFQVLVFLANCCTTVSVCILGKHFIICEKWLSIEFFLSGIGGNNHFHIYGTLTIKLSWERVCV